MKDVLKRFSVPGAAETENYLRRMGYPIVRRSEPLGDGDVADLVAYCLDEEHKLVPEVAVMLSDDSSIDTLTRLKDLADSLNASNALLVVNGVEYFWIKPERSVFPVDPPGEVYTTAAHLVKEQDLLDKANFVAEYLLNSLSLIEEICTLTAALQLNSHFYTSGEYERLEGVQSAEQYLELLQEKGLVPAVRKVLHGSLQKISDEALQRLIRDLREFPPAGPVLAQGFFSYILSLLSGKVSFNFNWDFVQGFFQEAVRLYPVAPGGRVLVANGFNVFFVLEGSGILQKQLFNGTALLNLVNNYLLRKSEASDGATEETVAWLARSLIYLGGIEGAEVKVGDPLQLEENGRYSMVLLVSYLNISHRAEHYHRFEVTKKKKSGKIDRNFLLLEKCLELAEADGIVWACVHDGILTNQSAKPLRELVLERAYVEAVIDFMPPLLILRKKGAGDAVEPQEVFMGNPRSEEQVEGVCSAFVSWKKGGDE